MIGIGKTGAELKELDRVMASAHNLKIIIQLLDLDHNYLKDLSDVFVDGMVSVDADAEITRALDLTLFDPFKQIHLDPNSPSKSSVYITNMIKVVYSVTPADRSTVFNIPVFCGPIDVAERDDVWIDIKALGKESLGLGNLWRGKTYKKNQEKTFVIMSVLRNLVGESKFNLVERKAKLPKDEKLNRATKPWKLAKALAKSMGLQLFYDGRGVCVLRKRPKKPQSRFRDTVDAERGGPNVTSVGQPVYDMSKTVNAVELLGKKKKNKKRIKARAVAKKKHSLSPFRLGRKVGTKVVPRYLWLSIEDNSVRTMKEARKIVKDRLKVGLLSGVQVKFTGIPNPRLQELDLGRIDTERVHATFVHHKFTIPLVAGDDATYGYLKRMTAKGGSRAIKAKKGKKHRKH